MPRLCSVWSLLFFSFGHQVEAFVDRIVLKHDTKKCLDLDGGNTNNGQRLLIWDCYETPNQEFLLGSDIIYKKDITKCVDFWGVDPKKGNFLQIWDCSDLHYHKWNYKFEDNSIRFEVGDKELCMTVEWDKTDNGTPVILWECHGGESQQWALADDEGNIYTGSKSDVGFIVSIIVLSVLLGVSLTLNCCLRRKVKKLGKELNADVVDAVAVGKQEEHVQLEDEASNIDEMSNQA